MIILIDGLSATGKSTLITKYLEKYPSGAVRFKGAGAVNIGMQGRWQEYNFWMHNIIERMDQLNDYKFPILWDRGLTDVVYTEDKNYSTELLRIIKSHIKKGVFYLEAPIDKLTDRHTKEGHENVIHKERYEDVIKSFIHRRITLTGDCYIKDEHVEELHKFIQSFK